MGQLHRIAKQSHVSHCNYFPSLDPSCADHNAIRRHSLIGYGLDDHWGFALG
jgi:hypothetical protein